MTIKESIIQTLSYNLFGENIICNKVFCYGVPKGTTVLFVEIFLFMLRALFFSCGAYIIRSICYENNVTLRGVLMFALLQWLHIANSFYSLVF